MYLESDHRWLNDICVLVSLVLLTMTAACASTGQPNQPAGDEDGTADGSQTSHEAPEADATERDARTAQEAQAIVDRFMANKVSVIKAATDIPAGTPLTDDKVTAEDIPARFLPPNPVLEDEFDIYVGTPVSTQIEEGAMILSSDFRVAQVSQNLSGRIPRGERALPLEFANLRYPCEVLEPGDRVDIVGTVPVDKDGEFVGAHGEAADRMTMTLLQNATALSIGPRISGVTRYDEEGGCAEFEAVSVSVTREEAELLSAVQSAGELRLMIRHREDVDTAAVERSSLSDMLEDVEKLAAEREARTERRPPPRSADDEVQIIRSED